MPARFLSSRGLSRPRGKRCDRGDAAGGCDHGGAPSGRRAPRARVPMGVSRVRVPHAGVCAFRGVLHTLLVLSPVATWRLAWPPHPDPPSLCGVWQVERLRRFLLIDGLLDLKAKSEEHYDAYRVRALRSQAFGIRGLLRRLLSPSQLLAALFLLPRPRRLVKQSFNLPWSQWARGVVSLPAAARSLRPARATSRSVVAGAETPMAVPRSQTPMAVPRSRVAPPPPVVERPQRKHASKSEPTPKQRSFQTKRGRVQPPPPAEDRGYPAKRLVDFVWG